MTKDRYISAANAARTLGVGMDYIYKLIWGGKVQARKIEGLWHVSERSVEERLQKRAAREAISIAQ